VGEKGLDGRQKFFGLMALGVSPGGKKESKGFLGKIAGNNTPFGKIGGFFIPGGGFLKKTRH